MNKFITKRWIYVVAALVVMKLSLAIWERQIDWHTHWSDLATNVDNRGGKINISEGKVTGRLGFSPYLKVEQLRIGNYFTLNNLEFRFSWLSWFKGVAQVKHIKVGNLDVSTKATAEGSIYMDELERLVDLFYLFEFDRFTINNIKLEDYKIAIKDFNLVYVAADRAEINTRLGGAKASFPIRVVLSKGKSGKWENIASTSRIVGITSQFTGRIDHSYNYPMLRGEWEFTSLDMPDFLRRILGASSLIPEGLRLDATYRVALLATRSAIEFSSTRLTSGIASGKISGTLDIEQRELELDATLDHLVLPFIAVLDTHDEYSVASLLGSLWDFNVNLQIKTLNTKDVAWKDVALVTAKEGERITIQDISLDWVRQGKIKCVGGSVDKDNLAGKLEIELDNIASILPTYLSNYMKIIGFSEIKAIVWNGHWELNKEKGHFNLSSKEASLDNSKAKIDVVADDEAIELGLKLEHLDLEHFGKLDDWYKSLKDNLNRLHNKKASVAISVGELYNADNLLGTLDAKFSTLDHQLLIEKFGINKQGSLIQAAGGLALHNIAPRLKLQLNMSYLSDEIIGELNNWITSRLDSNSAIPFGITNLPRLLIADFNIRTNKLDIFDLVFSNATLDISSKDNIYYFNRIEGDIYDGRVAIAGSFMPSSKVSKFSFNGRNFLLASLLPELPWLKASAVANASGNIATVGTSYADIRQNLTANLLIAAGGGTITSHNIHKLAYSTGEKVTEMLESTAPTYISDLTGWLASHGNPEITTHEVNGIEARLDITPANITVDRLSWFNDYYKVDFSGKIGQRTQEMAVQGVVSFYPNPVSPVYDYSVVYSGELMAPTVTLDYRNLANNLRYQRIREPAR